jgi:hypothetical protein
MREVSRSELSEPGTPLSGKWDINFGDRPFNDLINGDLPGGSRRLSKS